MPEETWIKLYRKASDHELIQDHLAWVLFTWLLLRVDRKTGSIKIGRYDLARFIKAKPITLYRALTRLERKHKVVTRRVTPKYTEISVLKWYKYQSNETASNTSGNISVTPDEHRGNTYTRIENKEYKKNTTYSISSPSKALAQNGETKPVLTEFQTVVEFLETTLNTKITNWGKQAQAWKLMQKAGYTREQIMKVIVHMATKDDFFVGKGFDLMTVCNQMPRYKAQHEAARQLAN